MRKEARLKQAIDDLLVRQVPERAKPISIITRYLTNADNLDRPENPDALLGIFSIFMGKNLYPSELLPEEQKNIGRKISLPMMDRAMKYYFDCQTYQEDWLGDDDRDRDIYYFEQNIEHILRFKKNPVEEYHGKLVHVGPRDDVVGSVAFIELPQPQVEDSILQLIP